MLITQMASLITRKRRSVIVADSSSVAAPPPNAAHSAINAPATRVASISTPPAHGSNVLVVDQSPSSGLVPQVLTRRSARRTNRRSAALEIALETVTMIGDVNPSPQGDGELPRAKKTRGPCRQLKSQRIIRTTNTRIPVVWDPSHHRSQSAKINSLLVHDIGAIIHNHCPMTSSSWSEVKPETQAEVLDALTVNFESDMNDPNIHEYITGTCVDRYRNWKHDFHRYFQTFFDVDSAKAQPPIELEHRPDEWVWLCDHFQTPTFLQRSKANKANRRQKKILHHSGSLPFSYRVEERRLEGSKFPEIDMFKDVYALPGNEVVVKLHETMVERRDAYMERVASQHPPGTPLEQLTMDNPDAGLHILTKTLESLGPRPGKIVWGMGKAKVCEVNTSSSASQWSVRIVSSLQSKVEELQNELNAAKAREAEREAREAREGERQAQEATRWSMLLGALQQSGINLSSLPLLSTNHHQPPHP